MRAYPIVSFLVAVAGSGAAITGCKACETIPNVVGNGATNTNRAIEALERAIASLDANSASWQSTLTNLEDQLVQDAGSLLANEVTNLMQRGVGTAGVELRCNADFIGGRMRGALAGLLAQLQNQPPPPPPLPGLCQVSPTSVDMGHRPNELDFFGYDFDRADVHVFLRHAGGETIIDEAVSRPTHYLLTVDVSEGTRAPLCNLDDRRIILRANGTEISSVSVVRRQCPAAPPPPPPFPQKVLSDQNQDCPGGLFGCRMDRNFGGPCTGGYHRTQCQVIQLEGSGHCEMIDWTSGNEHDCGCAVHFGAPALQGVKCRITILEAGDLRPAPAPPPCPCW